MFFLDFKFNYKYAGRKAFGFSRGRARHQAWSTSLVFIEFFVKFSGDPDSNLFFSFKKAGFSFKKILVKTVSWSFFILNSF